MSVSEEINDENNAIQLSFERLPGCFRYSGFIVFEVEVVAVPEEPPAPTCEDLTVTHTGESLAGYKF